jgi:hypothetical protein
VGSEIGSGAFLSEGDEVCTKSVNGVMHLLFKGYRTHCPVGRIPTAIFFFWQHSNSYISLLSVF